MSRRIVESVGRASLEGVEPDLEGQRSNPKQIGRKALAGLQEKLKRYEHFSPKGEELVRILNEAKGPGVFSAEDLDDSIVDRLLTKGMGGDEGIVKDFRSYSFWSGNFFPITTDIANFVTYVVAPLAGLGAVEANLAVALLASVANPVAQAWPQTWLVAASTDYRAQNAVTVDLDKAHINSEAYLPDQARGTSAVIGRYNRARAEAEALFSGRLSAPDRAAFLESPDPAGFVADRFDAAARREITSKLEELRACGDGLLTECETFLMTKDARRAKTISNEAQTHVRTWRNAVLSGGGVFGTKHGGVWGLRHGLSPGEALGLQVALFVLMSAWHHYAAMKDEQNRQYFDVKRMLRSDHSYLTDEGRARLKRGAPLRVGDVDLDAFAARLTKPGEGTVRRMIGYLSAKIEDEEAKGPAGSRRAVLDALRKIEHLRRGEITTEILDDEDLGTIAELADQSTFQKVFRSGSEVDEIIRGKREKGEFIWQYLSRQAVAASFPGGQLWNAWTGRVAATHAHGATHVPAYVTLGLTVWNVGVAAMAAWAQGDVTDIKDHERDLDPEDRNKARILRRGVVAPYLKVVNRRTIEAANAEVKATLKSVEADRRLLSRMFEAFGVALPPPPSSGDEGGAGRGAGAGSPRTYRPFEPNPASADGVEVTAPAA